MLANQNKNNEQGFALITALLVLVIMTIISIGIYQSTSIDLMIYGNNRNKAQARSASEAGVKVAERNILALDMSAKTLTDPENVVGKASYTAPTISGGMVPVGYEYGDGVMVPYYGRTYVSSWHRTNTSSTSPEVVRTLVVKLWQKKS